MYSRAGINSATLVETGIHPVAVAVLITYQNILGFGREAVMQMYRVTYLKRKEITKKWRNDGAFAEYFPAINP